MSRRLGMELLLSLGHATLGYAAAFVPLALRRVLAELLDWDPHPSMVWLLGSAVVGFLSITIVGIGRRPRITPVAIIRLLGRVLFGVAALPFGFICLVTMAPDAGITMLGHMWPFLCALVVSSAVGFLILRCSLSYDVK
jgi:hypothetical protein